MPRIAGMLVNVEAFFKRPGTQRAREEYLDVMTATEEFRITVGSRRAATVAASSLSKSSDENIYFGARIYSATSKSSRPETTNTAGILPQKFHSSHVETNENVLPECYPFHAELTVASISLSNRLENTSHKFFVWVACSAVFLLIRVKSIC